MAEMGIAHVAQDFGAYHAMTAVDALGNVLRIKRFEITWPSAAGIEFGVRFEQWGAAADAGVDAMFMMIPETPGKGAFRRRMAGYLVFERIELGAPFGIAFDDLVFHDEQLTSSSLAQSGGRAAYFSFSG